MTQHLALDGTEGASSRRTNFRQKPDRKIDPAGEAGWYLQYERERRGESLADAAKETRIKAKYLHALEQGALDQLPGWPYLIGYVRNYAKFLGLEPEPLTQHYLTFVKRPAMIERLAGRSQWFRSQMVTRTVAACAGTTAIAVLGLWAAFSDGEGTLVQPSAEQRAAGVNTAEAPPPAADPVVTGSIRRPELSISTQPPAPDPAAKNTAAEPKSSAILDGAVPTVRIKEQSLTGKVPVPRPVPRAAVPQNDIETALAVDGKEQSAPSDIGQFIASQIGADAQVPAASAPGTQPAGGESRIVLRARANVWVRVEDGEGNALLNQTLAQGEVFHVPNREGMVLIVRDAGALEFSLDGKPYARLGKPGQILVSHPLAPDKMRSLGG